MGTIADGVARMESDLWDLSSRIHLGSAERFIKTRSGRALAAWPRADDFSVESSIAEIKTAFVALYSERVGGPLFVEEGFLRNVRAFRSRSSGASAQMGREDRHGL